MIVRAIETALLAVVLGIMGGTLAGLLLIACSIGVSFSAHDIAWLWIAAILEMLLDLLLNVI